MIKKIFTTLLFVLFTSNAISAGSSSDTTTKKVKTDYDKAVAHVKSAKISHAIFIFNFFAATSIFEPVGTK